MRLLVFQHIACEHPGSLRKLLAADGVQWDAVELDEGESIPPLEGYDALWVMGGAMDVWDIEDNPWLVEEKAAIRRWVRDLGKPYLGFCLGHQLLADALGGTCGPQRPAEVGILDVELTDAGKADPIMAGLPARQKCLQWHGVRVAQEPEGTVVLASSDVCRVQAMRCGANAWSMQYHMEVEDETIDTWGRVPEYKAALEQTLGEGAHGRIKAEADANMAGFLSASEQLYRNFMGLARA